MFTGRSDRFDKTHVLARHFYVLSWIFTSQKEGRTSARKFCRTVPTLNVTLQCTMNSIQWTVYNEQCTMNSVQCTVYIVPSSLVNDTNYIFLNILYFVFCKFRIRRWLIFMGWIRPSCRRWLRMGILTIFLCNNFFKIAFNYLLILSSFHSSF